MFSATMPVLACSVLFQLLVVMTTAGPVPHTRLPQIFRSDMLLQRDTDYDVWGWARAGANVTVSVSGSAARSAIASAAGTFVVSMPPEGTALSRTLTVAAAGEAPIVLHNVAFGDQYFCSGQVFIICTTYTCLDISPMPHHAA